MNTVLISKYQKASYLRRLYHWTDRSYVYFSFFDTKECFDCVRNSKPAQRENTFDCVIDAWESFSAWENRIGFKNCKEIGRVKEASI